MVIVGPWAQPGYLHVALLLERRFLRTPATMSNALHVVNDAFLDGLQHDEAFVLFRCALWRSPRAFVARGVRIPSWRGPWFHTIQNAGLRSYCSPGHHGLNFE